MLIDAAVIIKKRLPDWRIDIFGEGEEKENLLAKIDELNLKDFIFIHDVTQNIRQEYLKSSLMLVCSRYEGFSLVLAEAQSCGLPAVTFDCPSGPADIVINNKTGFVVPLGDTQTLAEKTVELALDEKLRRQFGLQAKKLSMRFSTKYIARMWEDMLEKIVIEDDSDNNI